MRILFIILGTLSLALAMVGIAIPLLPTTPLLLLSAALYSKSSPKLYNRLINSKHLGGYIRQFREHRAITLHTKVVILTMMWGIMLWRVLTIPHLWLQILLPVVGIVVTLHILSFKTLKRE